MDSIFQNSPVWTVVIKRFCSSVCSKSMENDENPVRSAELIYFWCCHPPFVWTISHPWPVVGVPAKYRSRRGFVPKLLFQTRYVLLITINYFYRFDIQLLITDKTSLKAIQNEEDNCLQRTTISDDKSSPSTAFCKRAGNSGCGVRETWDPSGTPAVKNCRPAPIFDDFLNKINKNG